ncbi:sterol desaturase family protein [Thalassotalea euphylliae]|uniref:Sterol desaturase family protein n=1 Tax=Thalassotalea euphylliae TaxID=1655234 RepID=A0A3E0TQN8_9GAMM|nr:sterol desaturase family protein [Thalassotalea euphylliae]REL26808.1 sterol desaturase family protein [Thalassotalea euphylliae]
MPTPLEVLIDPVTIGQLIIYAVLITVEVLWPARQLARVPGWHIKTAGFFILYLYLATYLPLLWDPYLAYYQIVSLESVHPIISILLALLVFELLIYLWHRGMHKSRVLWRVFHQMHHSAERVDTFGAFYFSPLDMIGFTLVGSFALTVGVGLSPEAITWFLFITMFLVVFQHTNIKTPQWLGYFIQRPESHSVHHRRGVHAYNYSDLPIIDIIFGTFNNPRNFIEEVGFYKGASKRVGDMLMFRDIVSDKLDSESVKTTLL